MTDITVNLPNNSYKIAIAPGILPQLGELMQPLNLGKKVLVVSNPEIFAHYGNVILNSLESVGFKVFHHLLPAGEQFKNLSSIEKLYDTALEKQLERSSHFSGFRWRRNW